MNDNIKLKINAVVEKSIATAIKRELDEDTLPSFNSKELVFWITQTIIQTIAAPFVANAYEQLMAAITSKADEKGVVLTDEDSKKMFKDAFVIMDEAEMLDESWKKNWLTYEK